MGCTDRSAPDGANQSLSPADILDEIHAAAITLEVRP